MVLHTLSFGAPCSSLQVDESSIIPLNLNLIVCINRSEIAEKSIELRSNQGEFLALLRYDISISNYLSLVGKYLYDRGSSILHPIFPKKREPKLILPFRRY